MGLMYWYMCIHWTDLSIYIGLIYRYIYIYVCIGLMYRCLYIYIYIYISILD